MIANYRQELESPTTEAERQKLRGLIGCLPYASTNSRPDLGSRLPFLQGQINQACVQTLGDGNPIPVADIRFLTLSDAAYVGCLEHSYLMESPFTPRNVVHDSQ